MAITRLIDRLFKNSCTSANPIPRLAPVTITFSGEVISGADNTLLSMKVLGARALPSLFGGETLNPGDLSAIEFFFEKPLSGDETIFSGFGEVDNDFAEVIELFSVLTAAEIGTFGVVFSVLESTGFGLVVRSFVFILVLVVVVVVVVTGTVDLEEFMTEAAITPLLIVGVEVDFVDIANEVPGSVSLFIKAVQCFAMKLAPFHGYFLERQSIRSPCLRGIS